MLTGQETIKQDAYKAYEEELMARDLDTNPITSQEEAERKTLEFKAKQEVIANNLINKAFNDEMNQNQLDKEAADAVTKTKFEA